MDAQDDYGVGTSREQACPPSPFKPADEYAQSVLVACGVCERQDKKWGTM